MQRGLIRRLLALSCQPLKNAAEVGYVVDSANIARASNFYAAAVQGPHPAASMPPSMPAGSRLHKHHKGACAWHQVQLFHAAECT